MRIYFFIFLRIYFAVSKTFIFFAIQPNENQGENVQGCEATDFQSERLLLLQNIFMLLTKIAKKKTSIKKISSLRQKLITIYSTIRPQYLQHNKRCRAKLEGCKGTASEIHHMVGRSGFWLISSAWFLPICRNCHKIVTQKSREAITQGITISRHSNVEYDFNKFEKGLMEKHGVYVPTNKVRI